MHRVIEAELYGVRHVVLSQPDLTIIKKVGAFGTLHEIQCHTLWRYWRLHAILTTLPGSWQVLGTYGDEEDEDEGLIVFHYWEDAKYYVTTGGRAPAQIGQPAKFLP